MANYYVIRCTLREAFFTGYQGHNIIDLITWNFFVTRNKQAMTIGTNRMCISRDDNRVNNMCFPRQLPTTARKLFTTICLIATFFDGCDTICPIGKLPFSFLLCNEFLRRIFSGCHIFRSVSIRPNERFRKVLQS